MAEKFDWKGLTHSVKLRHKDKRRVGQMDEMCAAFQSRSPMKTEYTTDGTATFTQILEIVSV